jgi:hypothetical protein
LGGSPRPSFRATGFEQARVPSKPRVPVHFAFETKSCAGFPSNKAGPL